MADPPDELSSSGFSVGDVPPDFCLPDQTWATTSLWQFYGDVVVLDISTGWCGPCQQLAAGVQATADDYADEGFTYVTVLAQDVQHNVPDEADLDLWADSFGIAEPVVADIVAYSDTPIPGGEAFPGVWVIGRDMTVHDVVTTYTDEAVRIAIEAAL
jgi:thiol-disulfide isomerase/thioredoxin